MEIYLHTYVCRLHISLLMGIFWIAAGLKPFIASYSSWKGINVGGGAQGTGKQTLHDEKTFKNNS
jgi:hypothetical protein